MHRIQREYEKKVKKTPNLYEIQGGNAIVKFLIILIILMGIQGIIYSQ